MPERKQSIVIINSDCPRSTDSPKSNSVCIHILMILSKPDFKQAAIRLNTESVSLHKDTSGEHREIYQTDLISDVSLLTEASFSFPQL